MPFSVMPEAHGHTVALCHEKSWRVSVSCAKGHTGGWGAEELAKNFPAGVTLDQIAERLKCSTCGADEGVLTIRQDHGAQQRRDVAAYEAGKGKV